MKTLQNNFTTPKQSKRLLELGVPVDSADCYYTWKLDHTAKINVLDDETYSELLDHTSQITVHCWSVGRLIEIAKICSKSRYALRGLFCFLDECEADECMLQVMDYFEICNYQFDFSKLEE